MTTSAAVSISVANNPPPTVSITSPLNGASFTTGANIPIAANASDTAPGTVTSVQFFDGITSLGTDTTSPYTATLSNAAAGNHSLTAVATDNQGAVTTSAAVSISVANNPPPTVSITSPLNGASFTTGANIPIAANASDTAPGTVTSVQFFDGITSLGTDTTSPYTATLSNAAAGNHSLTAVATDNQGAVTTSAAVSISVANNTPPTVSITSPINNTGFVASSNVTINANASDTAPGTVASVQFFNGTTQIGATDTTSPFSVSTTALTVGNHTLTARATDNNNAVTTSSPVSIRVVAAGGTTFVTNMTGASEIPPVSPSGNGLQPCISHLMKPQRW